MSAEASVRRSDVVLLLIDADEGLTDQDAHIAGMAAEAGRGLVVLVNKWDLVDKDSQTAGKFVKDMHDRLSFVSHCPVVMVSALTGQRVHRILAEVDTVYAECTREVSTSAVNDWLRDATARLSPPWHKGRQLRIKYVTQTGVQPPTFRFFVNNPQLLPLLLRTLPEQPAARSIRLQRHAHSPPVPPQVAQVRRFRGNRRDARG